MNEREGMLNIGCVDVCFLRILFDLRFKHPTLVSIAGEKELYSDLFSCLFIISGSCTAK